MEAQDFVTSGTNKELSFRDIILNYIRKILDISAKELRDTTKTTVHGNYSQTVEQEDTRYSYIQAVDSLAAILIPYFDEKMTPMYEKFDKMNHLYSFEYYKEHKEEINDRFGEKNMTDELRATIFINEKVDEAKKVFKELNLLLKRIDYLSTTVYGEG